ncbi:sensor histidine kinase [Hymenobacter terrenus]|uniref:sensor histidine kinase n=1 Tax=Hymenobacter terrenus TaxID=1629124 RepID=UPI000619C0E2|nr:histidine kinase [Hymenobacter terrenus]
MAAFFRRHRMALLHVSFWSAYFSLYWYQYQSITEYTQQQAQVLVLVPLVSYWLIAYFNYFVLLPRWLVHQRLGQYVLEFIGPFGLAVALRILALQYLLGTSSPQVGYLQKPIYWISSAASTFFLVLFVGLLRFAMGWFELEARTKTLENAQLTAELKFLKAQINPHFLFNTLNNLYYLAYKQSPNTTEVIAKLSQMMRYMIEDSNHRQVLLSKEIEYMQNYISLEKLRLNHEIPIRLVVEGSSVEGVHIAPLLFITFLENAFKHGVSNNSPDAWVDVRIHLAAAQCSCTVENSKLPTMVRPASEAPSGLGLQNVQRRLELSYPGRYQLRVEDRPDRYHVHLHLTLAA